MRRDHEDHLVDSMRYLLASLEYDFKPRQPKRIFMTACALIIVITFLTLLIGYL